MALRHLAVALLLLAPLAGCSDRPLAAEAGPSMPPVVRGPAAEVPAVDGHIEVSTLPIGAVGPPGDDRLLNCIYVGEDSPRLIAVAHGSLDLAWTPESPGTAELTASLDGAGSATASGASPLHLDWSADGKDGPVVLPFRLSLRAHGEPGLALDQDVQFHVAIDGDVQHLEAVQADCTDAAGA